MCRFPVDKKKIVFIKPAYKKGNHRAVNVSALMRQDNSSEF